MNTELIFILPSDCYKEGVEKNIFPLKILDGISRTYENTKGLGLVLSTEINWPATKYLSEAGLYGNGITGDTVRSYGEALVTYLNYLDIEKYALNEVTESIIQKYKNFLLTNTFKNKRRSNNTINQKVSTVLRFHHWAEIYNHFSSPLGKFLVSTRSNQPVKSFYTNKPFSSPRSYSAKFFLRVEKKIPRALNAIELKELVKSAADPYSLIFKLAAYTGMRRSELCFFKLSTLPLQINGLVEGFREVKVDRKGGKQGTVYLTNKLIDELWWYVFHKRSIPEPGEEEFLFLTQNGRRISRQNLSIVFKKFITPIAPTATLHHLRHTFAITVLSFLQRNAELGSSINPLKTLQVLMGHSSIESTEIYLRALDIYSEEVEETLNYLYGDAL
ncbi:MULTISPECIES: tyrosine-type recombinase/integrase [Methylotenera]|uniref:tyrosine-type recombinase/integrase n=1 Tax=Methylotenera TaxID=359407 RepID=UPI00036F604D|nr:MULTISPECIES: tyrosine-type recombinase/integrase [Methylotenera]